MKKIISFLFARRVKLMEAAPVTNSTQKLPTRTDLPHCLHILPVETILVADADVADADVADADVAVEDVAVVDVTVEDVAVAAIGEIPKLESEIFDIFRPRMEARFETRLIDDS